MAISDPERAFPEEVLALRDEGVPLPTWYSGPLYTGNGSEQADRTVDRLAGSKPDEVIADLGARLDEFSAPIPKALEAD